MAEDVFVLDRLRSLMHQKSVEYEEKRMFGGHCFMVDDKMCFGTHQGGLMARVDPQEVETLTARNHATQMLHGGRVMKGYIHIEPAGYDMDADLEFWIDECLAFNPRAKSSKKK